MKSALAVLAVFLPMKTPPQSLNEDRMIEAICQIENGRWAKPGGRGCISRIAWRQHRPTLAYDRSAVAAEAMPVYREHLRWLMFNLAANKLPVTPATVYVCWRNGLESGVKILRRGRMPDNGTRCQNLYEVLP